LRSHAVSTPPVFWIWYPSSKADCDSDPDLQPSTCNLHPKQKSPGS